MEKITETRFARKKMVETLRNASDFLIESKHELKRLNHRIAPLLAAKRQKEQDEKKKKRDAERKAEEAKAKAAKKKAQKEKTENKS